MRHIVDQLLEHLAPPSTAPSAVAALQAASGQTPLTPPPVSPAYRLLLAQRILLIISNDTYALVTDFDWVISVLIDVAYVSQVDVGDEVRDMLFDVVGRVRSVRSHAVKALERVISEASARAADEAQQGLLQAAVWICGEYPRYA